MNELVITRYLNKYMREHALAHAHTDTVQDSQCVDRGRQSQCQPMQYKKHCDITAFEKL